MNSETISTGSMKYGKTGTKRHAARKMRVTRDDGTSYEYTVITCRCACSTSRGTNKAHSYIADLPGNCGN